MANGHLLQARDAFQRRAWGEARQAFAAARGEGEFGLDDLEREAISAHLFGDNEEMRDAFARGYREAVRIDEPLRAARFAFWIGHGLIFEGRMSEAMGWFARARQLIAGRGLDCSELGYLLIPQGIQSLFGGDPAAAETFFADAHAIARRFGDIDLTTLANHGRGRALIRLGRISEGMASLDEAIVCVTEGEVSPMLVGEVYCGVLEACREVFDLRRAREWTGVFSRWCEGQTDMAPYRGPCLVHRAEVLQRHGAWADALEEARRAREWLSQPASPEAPGDACYRIGELHRLLGEFDEAETAYGEANRLGRRPDPGLPLLWLANGRSEPARVALQRALAEDQEPARRAALFEALVEVDLAVGDVDAAATATEALRSIASSLESPAAAAMAETAACAVLIARGEAAAALAPLRRAWSEWQRLEAPYEAARVRMLIARAYLQIGDSQSAAMEFDAARSVFQQLGAIPDLAALEAAAETRPPSLPGGLTPREAEVLALLAQGLTNKEIGAALVISEHTVARHVQNMLARLGRNSRAGLAAFAVEHGIVSGLAGQN